MQQLLIGNPTDLNMIYEIAFSIILSDLIKVPVKSQVLHSGSGFKKLDLVFGLLKS